MKFETLATERLLLRKLTPKEYKFIFENYSRAQVKKELALANEAEYRKELSKFKKGVATYNRSFVQFQLIDKETGEIIGGCGYHTWYLEHSRAEIGYGLLKDAYKNKGIMTEAIKPVIEYGFYTMNLNRIEALIGPDNDASIKLIKKFNFKQEGYMRQHYFKNNFLMDSLIFALLKEEYESGK